MEYNPMEELGFFEDKVLVSNCHGFITRNDNARDLCGRFIRNGERLFDVLSRYDDLQINALSREEGAAGSALKMAVPFLKTGGVTDQGALTFSRGDLELVPGADRAMRYLSGLLPTFVTTGSYEHHMMCACDAVGYPMSNVVCTQVSFDSVELGRQEARELRAIANRISSMKVPRELYTVTEAKSLVDGDAEIITELDAVFQDRIPEMDVAESLKGVGSVGSNEKAYALLEIRRKTGIGFESTAYVGGDASDYQAMDLVRDSSGLSLSFNGGEYAVRGCNVAVMSPDATPAAVLAAEFYSEGIEAVYEMVDNWDRERLESRPCSDRHLMDAMLRTFPKKLPAVARVGRGNVDEIVEKSEAYRRHALRRR